MNREKSGFAPSSKSSDMEESLNRLLASARAESEERTPRFSAVSSNSQPTSLAAKRNRARDYGQLEGQVRGLGAKRGA
jgi:phage I-like protein